MEDNYEPEQVPKEPILPTNSGVHDSRVLSTSSKRSYDEHESDQFEGVEGQHSAPGAYICSEYFPVSFDIII